MDVFSITKEIKVDISIKCQKGNSSRQYLINVEHMSMMVSNPSSNHNDFEKVRWSGTIYSLMETDSGLVYYCGSEEQWRLCNPKVQEAYASFIADRELLETE